MRLRAPAWLTPPAWMTPPAWFTFARLAWATVGLTLVLVMLGIYTAATGSGLACSQQWPLCDGGVLPQTLPSFFEWLHRLVAMVAGWFILGTAAWTWRGAGDRRARAAATLAVVLLPLQIAIGAITVTLNGLLPRGYSTPTHAAHLAVALVIFGLLVLTAVFAWTGGRRGDQRAHALARARLGVLVALVALPPSIVLSRVVPAVAYSPLAQAAFYGLSLAAFAGLLAATVVLARPGLARARWLASGALVLLTMHLLLGRDLVAYTPGVRGLDAALVAVSLAFTGAAAWLLHRRAPGGTGEDGEAGGTGGDGEAGAGRVHARGE